MSRELPKYFDLSRELPKILEVSRELQEFLICPVNCQKISKVSRELSLALTLQRRGLRGLRVATCIS